MPRQTQPKPAAATPAKGHASGDQVSPGSCVLSAESYLEGAAQSREKAAALLVEADLQEQLAAYADGSGFFSLVRRVEPGPLAKNVGAARRALAALLREAATDREKMALFCEERATAVAGSRK